MENTMGECIKELREDRDWTQAELAERLHVARSQISRIESGETKNVSTDLLIAIAKELNVSADYLLGLTPYSTPRNIDVAALGLSEEAVRKLLSGVVDIDVLNRLLEHKNFPYLTSLIRNYYDNSTANGIMARNQIIDYMTGELRGQDAESADKRAEKLADLRYLNSQKIGVHEIDNEKINATFMGILKDIKAGIENNEPTGAVATKEALEKIKAELPQEPTAKPTMDDMAAALTRSVGQVAPLSAETLAAFQNLAKMALTDVENAGKEQEKDALLENEQTARETNGS